MSRKRVQRNTVRYVLVALFLLSLGSIAVTVEPASNTPGIFSAATLNQLASAVGVTVAVAPNPYNTLAEQLRNKELSLNEREQTIRRAELDAQTVRDHTDRTLVYLLIIAGILLILIALNFYFDWRRQRLAHA